MYVMLKFFKPAPSKSRNSLSQKDLRHR